MMDFDEILGIDSFLGIISFLRSEPDSPFAVLRVAHAAHEGMRSYDLFM